MIQHLQCVTGNADGLVWKPNHDMKYDDSQTERT